MNAFLIYTIKTILALGLFALVYRLVFLKDVNFLMRRIYLLVTLALSLILPFVNLSNTGIGYSFPSVVLNEVSVYSKGINTIREASEVPFSYLITWLYFIVAGILFLRILYQIIIVLFKARQYTSQPGNGFSLYRLKDSNVSFSFFRRVFIGHMESKEDLEKILAHERIHASQLHTLDVIITELLNCVLWFNPLIWWYRKELRNVHEYLADQGALECGFNRKAYQITLLEHLIGSASLSITNHFNYSLIKNRITMMNKEKNVKKNTWKVLLLLPVSLFLVLTFSCTEKKDATESLASSDEKEFYIVEDMPKFNGGDPAVEFRKYIAENLKYPQNAIENNVTGKVIIQFAVNSKGKVVDAKVVRSADPALDKEALRVITSSPDWEPGKQKGESVKVLFTFPISFALDSASK